MIEIDGHHLTIPDVEAVARRNEPVSLSTAGMEAILRSRSWLEQILREDKPVYGINTGFGIFAEQRIKPEARDRLSRNLILSHAVATGTPFPDDIVRAAMLIRANTLTRGHSGVRIEVVQTLLEMLNRNVVPLCLNRVRWDHRGISHCCPIWRWCLLLTPKIVQKSRGGHVSMAR